MIFGKGKKKYAYDPDRQTPAVRKSICTGEMTVGFIDNATGRFHDAELVTSEEEVERFRRAVGADELKIIY